MLARFQPFGLQMLDRMQLGPEAVAEFGRRL
jgi:hypothetical protein